MGFLICHYLYLGFDEKDIQCVYSFYNTLKRKK